MDYTVTAEEIAYTKEKVVGWWRYYVKYPEDESNLILLRGWSERYRDLVSRPNGSTPSAGEAILATF